MELKEALTFVGGRHNGVLATLKRDGLPQLSNITYHLGTDGLIRISTAAARAKATNLRRNPRSAMWVGRDDFGGYVVVEGQVELSPVSADEHDATVEELIVLYRDVLGEHPDWDDYRRAMVHDRRLVIRLKPARAYGLPGDG